MAWFGTYNYRKKINITGSVGAGTDYVFKLLVGETAGASGEDFDLEGHCKDFPNDIRFTDNDETTELDYAVAFLSGTTPNQLAEIWVKVSDDLGSNQSIYIYYGKSGDSDGSDGWATTLAWDFVPNGAESVLASAETFVLDQEIIPTDVTEVYILENGNIVYDSSDLGKEYKMVYGAVIGGVYAICAAYCDEDDFPEGPWTKHGVLFAVQATHSYQDPFIVWNDDDSIWHCYLEDNYGSTIGVRLYTSQTSDFWGTWDDQGEVVSKDVGDYGAASPVVWKEGEDDWHMWYEELPTSATGEIWYATSLDGISWSVYGSNPVLDKSGSGWDSTVVVPDDIYKVGSTYWMTYHGLDSDPVYDFTWGLAYSTDKTTWTRYADNPLDYILGRGTSFSQVYHTALRDYLITHIWGGDSSGIWLGYPHVLGDTENYWSTNWANTWYKAQNADKAVIISNNHTGTNRYIRTGNSATMVEILAAAKCTDAGRINICVGFGTGITWITYEHTIVLEYNDAIGVDAWRVLETAPPASLSLKAVDNAFPAWAVDTLYHIRMILGVDSGDVIKVRCWADGVSEPATWNVEDTNSFDHSGSTCYGLFTTLSYNEGLSETEYSEFRMRSIIATEPSFSSADAEEARAGVRGWWSK